MFVEGKSQSSLSKATGVYDDLVCTICRFFGECKDSIISMNGECC